MGGEASLRAVLAHRAGLARRLHAQQRLERRPREDLAGNHGRDGVARNANDQNAADHAEDRGARRPHRHPMDQDPGPAHGVDRRGRQVLDPHRAAP